MASQFVLQQNYLQGREPISETFFNIFNDYLKTDSAVSAAQVATDVSNLAPKPNAEERTLESDFFWQLWGDIIAVVEQVPHDHPGQDKLVKFMRELTLLPDTGVTVWGNRLWVDLPVLGAVFREHLNGPDKSDVEEEQIEIDKAWVRFHAFEAKLIGAGVVQFEPQLIWMMRDALEEETVSRSLSLDRGLITAAMYIEYAGPILVQYLAVNPDPELDDRRKRSLRGGSLFKDKTGMQLERWMFWMKRFREESEKTRSEEAKVLALRAARLMEVWSETRLKT
ncbi:hypothetical protein F5B20DRAFT_523289 [Whalleya microplaca]|nr:hypothetical protein F5B20DRAFT_523289 [Whalleya microplaca]